VIVIEKTKRKHFDGTGPNTPLALLLASLPPRACLRRPRRRASPPAVTIMANINPMALYNACVAGDVAAVSRLLPAGGTPRNLSGQRFQSPTTKRTPLIAAAEGGHMEIVRIILQRARHTSLKNATARGYSAPLMAALYHHTDILRLLLDGRGANGHLLVDREGNSALCLAIRQIHPDAPPRDPDPDGARQVAAVRALLQLGAGTLPALALPFDLTYPPDDPCAIRLSFLQLICLNSRYLAIWIDSAPCRTPLAISPHHPSSLRTDRP